MNLMNCFNKTNNKNVKTNEVFSFLVQPDRTRGECRNLLPAHMGAGCRFHVAPCVDGHGGVKEKSPVVGLLLISLLQSGTKEGES